MSCCDTTPTAVVSIATRVDIVCWRGDTFELIATIKDANGTAVDLSLFTWKMEVREYDSGPLVISSSNITVTGTSLGVLTVNISATNMLVNAGTYVYEIQATDTTPTPDVVTTYLYGQFTVTQDIAAN
jgi:archaellum component FlaF (FlaF/FlaG flagellin family)